MADYSYEKPTPWGIFITEAVIENGVTGIGDNAFDCCFHLTSITLPNSVTVIGANAFADCVGLMSITIPNSVTSISTFALSGCTNLTTVWYEGSEADRGETTIGEGNEVLASATWHYADNVCDADCNICDATREVPDHVYDNDQDDSCNKCGFKRAPLYTPGDLDDVEGVSSADAIYLLYYTLFPNRYPI